LSWAVSSNAIPGPIRSSASCGSQASASAGSADRRSSQAVKILDGKARDVQAGIRRRASSCGYSTKEREGADTCAIYLENKKDY
jgi:hypothetical protein